METIIIDKNYIEGPTSRLSKQDIDNISSILANNDIDFEEDSNIWTINLEDRKIGYEINLINDICDRYRIFSEYEDQFELGTDSFISLNGQTPETFYQFVDGFD
jgi:hypothetical protein